MGKKFFKGVFVSVCTNTVKDPCDPTEFKVPAFAISMLIYFCG